MKLNFWQWVGIIVVIIAAVVIYRRGTAQAPTAPTTPAPTTAPATQQ